MLERHVFKQGFLGVLCMSDFINKTRWFVVSDLALLPKEIALSEAYYCHLRPTISCCLYSVSQSSPCLHASTSLFLDHRLPGLTGRLRNMSRQNSNFELVNLQKSKGHENRCQDSCSELTFPQFGEAVAVSKILFGVCIRGYSHDPRKTNEHCFWVKRPFAK